MNTVLGFVGRVILVGLIIYGTYLFGHMWELVLGLEGVE